MRYFRGFVSIPHVNCTCRCMLYTVLGFNCSFHGRNGVSVSIAVWKLNPVPLHYLTRQHDWTVWGESYATYSCISSLFTSIFHLFAACYVLYSLASLFRTVVFVSIHSVCLIAPPIILPLLFVTNTPRFARFCGNTILVSFNHTNNVFESIRKNMNT